MEKATLSFTIPEVPGSVNHLYGQTRFGRKYIKPQGKAFKSIVHNSLSNIDIPIAIFENKLCIKFTIYFKSLRKRDLDNCMKILWDSLEGHLFEDDFQIDEYTVIRAYDKEYPRVFVEVENII